MVDGPAGVPSADPPFGVATTFVAELRLAGLDVSMPIEGPMTGDARLPSVREVLVPPLRPGDVVMTDDLGYHRSPKPHAAIEAARGCLVPLPACSPDCNSIDFALAEFSSLVRATAACSG